MVSFWPAALAFFLNCNGITMFREVEEIPGPVFSLFMFIFSLFILLVNTNLYPKSFRKPWYGRRFVEFLVCQFIMEYIIKLFWFPLERTLLDSFPKLADFVCDILHGANWSCNTLIGLLKSGNMEFAISYIVSCFCLLCSLHATRYINLYKLKHGLNLYKDNLICEFNQFHDKN